MFKFIFFSLFYPGNLYVFEHFFSKSKSKENLKVKVSSILFSCVVLLTAVGFDFSFKWNWEILKYFAVGISPFILPWLFTEPSDEERITTFLFWRNFIIAPTCEELYYRLLLPRFQRNIFALSLSFSLAHAHPLIFAKNWNKTKIILAQCLISFCFGFVCNLLRIKMTTTCDNCNFWVLAALSIIHGVANYCGFPLIEIEKGKILFYAHITILLSSLLYLTIN